MNIINVKTDEYKNAKSCQKVYVVSLIGSISNLWWEGVVEKWAFSLWKSERVIGSAEFLYYA